MVYVFAVAFTDVTCLLHDSTGFVPGGPAFFLCGLAVEAGVFCFIVALFVGHQQFHRRRAAFPRSPVQDRERAQKDFLRALSFLVFGLGAGALRLELFAAL